ncbi:uncharacterized protein LOC107018720 isoform X3 [Solanum pennellii]|uniref:Uncharacterized protein LOC107018720 isoform X3 n=1 Tax=Solanum pennellii TaxID=28526 RepID=A0ABM1GRA2_SOLPN|nr:uncharacterized protein LOC107018720 isoform X3 [Solanum pennellii]
MATSSGYLTNSFSKRAIHESISAFLIMSGRSSNLNSSSKGKKQVFRELRYAIPQSETESTCTWNLHFDRLDEQVLDQENRHQFMAHEAVLDEEYWTAAWLRAESHWENRQNDRFVNNYKRKYAEQVRAEDKIIGHTVLNSVVGTLDLIIGHLSSGESFPWGRVNAPDLSNIERSSINRYGYIANLCVLKSSRRKGVARNMLHFAIRLAKEYGAEKVFVHVHTNNGPAQKLYQNVGFQVVEVKNHKLAEEQPHLLFLRA